MRKGSASLNALKGSAYDSADHKNKEGFPSWAPTIEEEYLQVLMTNTVGPAFYADTQDMAEQTKEVHKKMAAHDTEFMAKAIVLARNEGYMRLQPIYGLAVLSTVDTWKFKEIFPKVIKTPNDLKQFIWICREGGVRKGLGRAVKTAINDYMCNLSEYHTLKYKEKGRFQYALSDVLRLTKPKTEDNQVEARWRYLLQKPKTGDAELLPQITAFEQFKVAKPGERSHYIYDGKLPANIVTGVGNLDMKEWLNVLDQMPIMATIMSLRAMNGQGVLKEDSAKTIITDRLTDENIIRRSRLFPFRFLSARKAVETSRGFGKPANAVPRWVYEKLEIALDIAYQNVPALPGDTLIGYDLSGSMSTPVGRSKNIQAREVGCLMTAALYKRNPDHVIPIGFTEEPVLPAPFSSRDTLTAITKALNNSSGGTRLVAPIEYAVKKDIKFDFFIGITDNEEWSQPDHYGTFLRFGGSFGRRRSHSWAQPDWKGFLDGWRAIRKKNPNAQAFLITLLPYSDRPTPPAEPGVHYIYGWSENILNYIAQQANGGYAGMVEQLKGKKSITRDGNTVITEKDAAAGLEHLWAKK